MSPHSTAEASTSEVSTESSFVAMLREMNEVRMAWVVSPRTRRNVVWSCATTGAWGILSGYAVFFLLWEEGKDKPLTFAIGLLVAVVVAFIAESMRELIQHGRLAGQGRGAGPRIVVTILMLAVFELFVMAYHEASGIREPTLGHIRAGVLGPVLSHERTAWWDVGAMLGLWVIVGGVVAWQLTAVIVRATGKRSQQVRFGVKVGGRAALVAAPLGVLAYVLVARAISSIAVMTTKYDEWERNLYNILANEHIPALAKMAVLPVSLLNKLSHLPVFGPAIVVLLILGLVFWCRMSRKWVPLMWLGAGGIIIMAAPLLIDDKGFESLLWLPLLAAIIWGVPGVVLGGIAPLLERPSQEPRKWGLIAYLSAAFLLCLTLLRLMYPGFLIPEALANPWWLGSAVVLLGATGMLFHRGGPVEQYWPLVALCIALIICGSMLILQQATFLGVLGSVHAVNNLPDAVPGKIDISKLIQISLKTFRPPPEQDIEELSEQIKASSDLPWDRQLVQTRELLR